MLGGLGLGRNVVIAIALSVAFVATGCGPRLPAPDLQRIYNRSDQHHGPDRNPVIVVPGILGSKLRDEASQRLVWGTFGGRKAVGPGSPAGARLVALPMAEGKSLNELRDDVVPDGVLDRLEVRLFGLPFNLKAYLQILVALGVGGYRDAAVDYGDIDYGEDHFTCFQFDYDWRRDVAENARLLQRFIEEKAAAVREESLRRFGEADPDLRFDVVAHSMGGLLLRYQLRYGDSELPADGPLPEPTWAGAELVERAIFIGTPNAGSLDALEQLVRGRRFGPLGPSYPPAIVGTFPALYQLLPRPRHGALFDSTGRELDVLDPQLWRDRGWGLAAADQDKVLQRLLPDVSDAAERRRIALDHQAKSLRRAARLHALLDRPATPPDSVDLYLVAGDAVPTPRSYTADGGDLRLRSRGPGDGTVLRSSALLDERTDADRELAKASRIGWRQVIFLAADHLGLTRSTAFTDNLLFLLLESPRDEPRSAPRS